MKLSTVTNLFQKRQNGSSIPLEEAMSLCRKAGFTTLDLSVSRSSDQEHPLNGPHWEQWIETIGNEAARLGVSFESAHLPFFRFDGYAADDPQLVHLNRAKARSIAACGRLGVKWAVDHLTHTSADCGFVPQVKQKNLAYFAPYIEQADKEGVGLAFENLFPSSNHPVCYPVAAWELIDFVDTTGAANVGVCWDFGHANLLFSDQSLPLRQLGSYLKATHVHDNWGDQDAHQAPFAGNIDWPSIMATLREIGYSGNFTLELGKMNAGKPDPIQMLQARHVLAAGRYLLSLATDNNSYSQNL